MVHCSVITIATNKQSYLTFAFNMAQSVLLHNDIRVYILTNLNQAIPKHLKGQVTIIIPLAEHAAMGIGMKLYLDKYLQTEHTLYIDSDCLCYDSLDPIFAACVNKNVSVAGTTVNAADWVGGTQARTIEQEFGLNQLIRFNGGMYYLRKNEKTAAVYDLARSIIPNYDKLGFQRLKGNVINEEGLISIAMVKYQEYPIADDGCFMTDLSTDTHPKILNVLKGERILRNPAAGMGRHRPWYPNGIYSPIIIHFGGGNLKSYIYFSQAMLLRLRQNHFSTTLSTAAVALFIHIPFKSARWLIGLFRK